MGQYDPKEMCLAAPAVGLDDSGTRAEVDLCLVAGPAFKTAEREFGRRHQSANEAPDAVVVAVEVVLGDQILIDALCAETAITLGRDDIAPRLAVTAPTAAAHTVRRLLRCRRAGGRNGWF